MHRSFAKTQVVYSVHYALEGPLRSRVRNEGNNSELLGRRSRYSTTCSCVEPSSFSAAPCRRTAPHRRPFAPFSKENFASPVCTVRREARTAVAARYDGTPPRQPHGCHLCLFFVTRYLLPRLRRTSVLRVLLSFVSRRASGRLRLRPSTSLSDGVVPHLARIHAAPLVLITL